MNAQIKELAKRLCEKSPCHHKCLDTKDCVVEDEAKEVIANSATTTEKQIEEMAKVICNTFAEKKYCEACPTPWCYAEECATLLYCAGYRKQSEVTREIFEEIDGITDLFAKGLIGELEMYDKLAEFKKKRTEGEDER